MADACPNSAPAATNATTAQPRSEAPRRGGRGDRGRGRGRGRVRGGRASGWRARIAERVAVAESAAAADEMATEEVATMAEGNTWTDSTTSATQQAQQRQAGQVSRNEKRKGKKRARDGLPGAEGTSAAVAGGARNAEGESAEADVVEENKRTKMGKKDKGPAKEQAPRPTHFLSLSLATDPTLRARLTAFGDALLAASPPVAGLDRSIVIDPRRVHLTLGVMRLEKEDSATTAPVGAQTTVGAHGQTESRAQTALGGPNTPVPKKTVSTALALLQSLAPQLAALGPARVELDRLGVLKTQRGGREAHVLWVGPREAGEGEADGKGEGEGGIGVGGEGQVEGEKEADGKGEGEGEVVGKKGARKAEGRGAEKSSLHAIADLVHQTFRREGYVTETRPLKLHVTLLNTTHRKKPRRRLAFSYTDVLRSEAVKLLGAVLPGHAKEAPDAEAAMVKRASTETAMVKHASTETAMLKHAIAAAEEAELDAEAQEQIEAGGDAIVPDVRARGEIARVLADGEVARVVADGEIARVVARGEIARNEGEKSDVRVDVVEVDIPAHPASGAPSAGLNSRPTASSAHSASSTAQPSTASSTHPTSTIPHRPSSTFPTPHHPIPIALGSYEVRAVHLCEMGSHGPDNEYVSVGCVEF